MADPFDLARFTRAQDSGGTYATALAELRRGQKASHWMWFVFPQLGGLGSSPTSIRYAITSIDEAVAYLDHPVLGARLLECAGVVAATAAETAEAIFGGIDAQKLRSSMTLFRAADRTRTEPGHPVFQEVLDRYFGGEGDSSTESLLHRG